MYMARFNKWGMSHSILASLMITDLIVKGGTKYQDLFNPSRKVLFAKTLSYNLKMVKTFVKTKLINQIKNIELKQNEGKIDRINGKKYGFCKDENNKIYIVNLFVHTLDVASYTIMSQKHMIVLVMVHTLNMMEHVLTARK